MHSKTDKIGMETFSFSGAKFWRLLTLMRKVNRKLIY